MALEAVTAALEKPLVQMTLALFGIALVFVFIFVHSIIIHSSKSNGEPSRTSTFETYVKFCYVCFFKPHSGEGARNQQVALESFYEAQASIYDATRRRLLHGREDMLRLCAGQLKHRIATGQLNEKPIWIDIGGGTGYNIESFGQDVPTFFAAVYVVDFSPSLCRIARDRFARLGWKNVTVVCEDARHFRLEDYQQGACADLITMSYSLSMIPDYYSVVDSITTLLSKNGIIGVADFYVQSEVDYQSRNYLGGEINRHCMWISRVFWKNWFDFDRVNLEGGRRDYLEYKFPTVLNFNARCRVAGLRIPYYVWIGCSKDIGASQLRLEQLNAAATESPFISALDLQSQAVEKAQRSSAIDIRSKAYECAIVNLAASLPLPPAWYQAHHWRIYFDDQLSKYKQFNDGYIYAFTWEDSKVDARLLKIQADDVILAITSAGDNILSYALEKPKRIHAVDLNPAQNHLLELKLAAFTALGYSDVWELFGDGKCANFHDLLITKLSPHMSSLAFQYWLHNGPKAFSGNGLYYTGGSGRALRLVKWLFKLLGVKSQVDQLCDTQTLNEQREIWYRSIRRILLSRLISWTIISNKKWLWRALGVPSAQREMIEQDYLNQAAAGADIDTPSNSDAKSTQSSMPSSRSAVALWEYATNTLDPVISHTLLSNSNHYYLLCLLGRYTRRCHPEYLSPKAHATFSKPNAFDGIRIHTDEVGEVLERMSPGTLSIAVLMDSMDWFAPSSSDAEVQIRKVRRALKVGGRILLRSASVQPWYVATFEELGFAVKRVAVRTPGECMDRVNMYASTWICTKVENSTPEVPIKSHEQVGSLTALSIGEAMQS